MATRTRDPKNRLAGLDPVETDDAATASRSSNGADADDGAYNFFAQFDELAGRRVLLDRLEPRDAAGYLGSHDATVDFLDYVREKFGGGKYGGRVYKDGDYETRLPRFTIAGPPKRESDAARLAPSPEIVELRDQVKALTEAMQRSRETPPADPMAMLTQVAGVMKLVRDLTPQPAAPVGGGGLSELVGAVNQMMELRQKMVDDMPEPKRENSGAEWARTLNNGLTTVASLLNRKLSIDERRLGMSAATRGATAAVTNDDPIVVLASGIPGVARSYLVRQAQAGKDPSLYADVVLDSLSAEHIEALRANLGREDFVIVLCQAVPEFAAHQEWIAQLAAHMREIIAAHDVDAVPATDPGDGGDAGGDRTHRESATAGRRNGRASHRKRASGRK